MGPFWGTSNKYISNFLVVQCTAPVEPPSIPIASLGLWTPMASPALLLQLDPPSPTGSASSIQLNQDQSTTTSKTLSIWPRAAAALPPRLPPLPPLPPPQRKERKKSSQNKKTDDSRRIPSHLTHRRRHHCLDCPQERNVSSVMRFVCSLPKLRPTRQHLLQREEKINIQQHLEFF